MKTFEHELIICIVNEGFSDLVMDTAREVGARGGTVVDARGTANKEAEKVFSISIQPQKEMVMIVVPTDLRDTVMHALYKEVGLNTPGQGIAFAMPIDNVVGISNAKVVIKEPNDNENGAEETAEEQSDENAENADETADETTAEETVDNGESNADDSNEPSVENETAE